MKKTILCIDDIQTNLFIVKSLIEDMSADLYEIILVSSANEGLSILLKQEIDLILMDVMMPDINGLEATQMIKSNKKTKNIPVIFLTAKNDDETIDKCYSVGGDDYVSKPFNHVELLARIAFHINSKEKDKLLLEEKEYTQNILDLQENLILVSSGKQNISVNKAFLNFYDSKNFKEFNKKCKNIADTFVEDDEYFNVKKISHGLTWVQEIIKLSQTEDVLVKIFKNDDEYIFNVKAISFKRQYIITFTDITHISQLASGYKYEANFDALTQIYNRNMFHRLIGCKITSAQKNTNSFVFIIFDIDFFKNVNDTHGHLVGDDVLVNLASLVKNNIRDDDVLARWGGEEFVLAFDVGKEKGIEIANNLRINIESYTFKEVDKITCSFGVTMYKTNDTLDDIIQRADDALYEAKDTGRNKVIFKA